MKIFVAGASGAIGRRLVPRLIEQGHEVTGTTRSPGNTDAIARLGAKPVVLDGLDAEAVTRAVVAAAPEVIIHQMTSLAGPMDLKKFDQHFAMTNRLRTEGVDNLIRAGRAAGVRRLIVQSYSGLTNIREGGPVKTEDDPYDPDPPQGMRESFAAFRHLEAVVPAAEGLEGVVLRYGPLYGPGTSLGEGGLYPELMHKRQFPIVGDGSGIWSFIHVDDAASATVAAVERGAPGIYNIVDDEPAPVAEWLPWLAETVGAKPPRRVPVWLGRLFVGEVGIMMMTQLRGSSNAKAKRELGWAPQWSTWRDGFDKGLSDRPAPVLLAAS
jgi:nucleoside-diphosphate-sugar epimerase